MIVSIRPRLTSKPTFLAFFISSASWSSRSFRSFSLGSCPIPYILYILVLDDTERDLSRKVFSALSIASLSFSFAVSGVESC